MTMYIRTQNCVSCNTFCDSDSKYSYNHYCKKCFLQYFPEEMNQITDILADLFSMDFHVSNGYKTRKKLCDRYPDVVKYKKSILNELDEKIKEIARMDEEEGGIK